MKIRLLLFECVDLSAQYFCLLMSWFTINRLVSCLSGSGAISLKSLQCCDQQFVWLTL